MEQNKQHFNIWKYLPTWKEAKWWVILGAIWALLSSPVVSIESVREFIGHEMGYAMTYLSAILPIVWALLLYYLVDPSGLLLYSPVESIRIIFIILVHLLSVILGCFAGYILSAIAKIPIIRTIGKILYKQ